MTQTEPIITDFLKRHPDLRLIQTLTHPMAWPTSMVAREDGILLGLSVDYGGYRHLSVSKRLPPEYDLTIPHTEEECRAFVDDFFSGCGFTMRKGENPLVMHYFQVGHPEA